MHSVSMVLNVTLSLCSAAHPGYSPKPNQVAIIGQPFYLDFGYTLAKPPTSYRWRKNGKDFTGDGERVITDHTGVIFARVVQEDAGQYTVVARNGAGEATAQAVLRGNDRNSILALLRGNDYNSGYTSSTL